MNIKLRLEQPKDYRTIEELTREAFWGSMTHPTTDGEHLLVHKLRQLPSFIPELDYVAEVNGVLVGNIIYSKSKVVTPDSKEIEVLNFGPLSVLPKFKNKGIGTALMIHTINEAKRLQYRAIIFYGHPDYYPRFGFKRAVEFGITSANSKNFDALMAMELFDGALDGITGRYVEDPAYEVDPSETAAFDKGFPYKAPVALMPINVLTDYLKPLARQAFEDRQITVLAKLNEFSGREMSEWIGIDQAAMGIINDILVKNGYSRKIFPISMNRDIL